MTEALRRFIERPRVNWDVAFNSINPAAIQTLEKEADALCQLGAEISGYLSGRGADGGHEEALKDAQKGLRKVRKALGYNRP